MPARNSHEILRSARKSVDETPKGDVAPRASIPTREEYEEAAATHTRPLAQRVGPAVMVGREMEASGHKQVSSSRSEALSGIVQARRKLFTEDRHPTCVEEREPIGHPAELHPRDVARFQTLISPPATC